MINNPKSLVGETRLFGFADKALIQTPGGVR